MLQRASMEDCTGEEICKAGQQVKSGCGGARASATPRRAAEPQEAGCLDCKRGNSTCSALLSCPKQSMLGSVLLTIKAAQQMQQEHEDGHVVVWHEASCTHSSIQVISSDAQMLSNMGLCLVAGNAILAQGRACGAVQAAGGVQCTQEGSDGQAPRLPGGANSALLHPACAASGR